MRDDFLLQVSPRAQKALRENGLTYDDFLARHRNFDVGEGIPADEADEDRASGEAGGPFASIFALPDDEELIVYTYAGGTPTRIILHAEFSENSSSPT